MKIGLSIWTFVSLHAVHNITAQMIFSIIPQDGALYLDYTGSIYLGVLFLFTLTIWKLNKKKTLSE